MENTVRHVHAAFCLCMYRVTSELFRFAFSLVRFSAGINAVEGRSSKAGNFTLLRIVTFLLCQFGNVFT